MAKNQVKPKKGGKPETQTKKTRKINKNKKIVPQKRHNRGAHRWVHTDPRNTGDYPQ